MKEPVSGTARAQVTSRLLDLSLGGALLTLEVQLDVGTIHDFALQLGPDSVWVQAEVKHCRAIPGGFEVGIEIIGIDPHDRDRLRSYLGERK